MIIAEFQFTSRLPYAVVRAKNGSRKERKFTPIIDTGSYFTCISYTEGLLLGFQSPLNEEEIHYLMSASGRTIDFVWRNVDFWIGNKRLKNFRVAWLQKEGLVTCINPGAPHFRFYKLTERGKQILESKEFG